MNPAWILWAAPFVAADLETARQAAQGHPEIVASPAAMPRPSRTWATAVASVITNRPLLPKDPRREAALWLVWAFHESGYRDDIRSSDGLDSVCTMQVRVFPGDPYTAAELVADPNKCVAVARRRMGESFSCDPLHPMACYAAGPAPAVRAAGAKISDARFAEVGRVLERLERHERQPEP